MSNPVVHFEIIGKNPEALRVYYETLFGWQAETDASVPPEISGPGTYGFIDKNSTEDGTGIPGGIGGGDAFKPQTIFYVGVSDVEAALQQAEVLGGKRSIGPVVKPGGGLVVSHFFDPEGNLIGVAGPQ